MFEKKPGARGQWVRKVAVGGVLALLAGGLTALATSAAPAAANPVTYAPIACDGNGTSGKRVQLVYVRGSSQASRYSALSATFQSMAVDMDRAFQEAGQRTGGQRQIRFVQNPATCAPIVDNVVVPQAVFNRDEGDVADYLRDNLGYNSTNRKYVVWWDKDACGLAFGLNGDDSPGPGNLFNSGPYWGFVGAGGGCFSWSASAHELLHALGAVNSSAPHASLGAHCWDDEDILCYDDGTLPPSGLVELCPGASPHLIDCNADDYFNVRPPAGSYLADHWNVANSQYLIAGPTVTSSCSVAYTVTNSWPGGFQGSVTVTNTGPAISNWELKFVYPGTQQINSLWGVTAGAVHTQSGPFVTVSGPSWASSLPKNGSVTAEFNATFSGTNYAPSAYILNGTTCLG